MTLPALEKAARPRVRRGLCTTCCYEDVCMYGDGARAGVTHCELFDDGRDQRPVCAPSSELHLAHVASPLGGLCSDCEARETCMLRPARGGVWCCEEYR